VDVETRSELCLGEVFERLTLKQFNWDGQVPSVIMRLEVRSTDCKRGPSSKGVVILVLSMSTMLSKRFWSLRVSIYDEFLERISLALSAKVGFADLDISTFGGFCLWFSFASLVGLGLGLRTRTLRVPIGVLLTS